MEEHLRKLGHRHGIPIETLTPKGLRSKKADMLNANLTDANVYNKNQQKIVTGWLGIRNSAAHGNYDEYTKEQISSLIEAVRDFITRYPA